MNEGNLEEQKNQPEVNDEPVENNELDIEISDLPDDPDKKRKGVLVGSTALILVVIMISVAVTMMTTRR